MSSSQIATKQLYFESAIATHHQSVTNLTNTCQKKETALLEFYAILYVIVISHFLELIFLEISEFTCISNRGLVFA